MKKIQFISLYSSRLITRYFRRVFHPRPHHSFQSNPLENKKPKKAFLIHGHKYLVYFVFFVAILTFFWIFYFKISSKIAVSEGIIGLYNSNNIPPIVANLISDSLVSLDQTGSPLPNLAVSWEASNEATIYKFKLRDNLYWNDGSKLKSSEIQFNLQDVEVSYPDEQTIQFKLADSFAPFPTLLTMPVFKNHSLVGVGKYKVIYKHTNHDIVTKLVLTPVTNSENLPEISIRFYPDEKTARIAFELGEVESLVGLVDDSELKDQPSVGLKRVTNFNRLIAIFYNTKDPILSDKNLRRALGLLTPNIEGEERAKSPVPPNSWAYNSQVRDLSNDQAAAKTYLSKVNAWKESNITLTTTPSLSNLANTVLQSWKQAGISGVLRVESGVPQNFQALLIAQPLPSDPDQYALWHSTQSITNFSKYSSPRVDKDLEDGRKTSDLEKRKEKYLDFQKIILDDSPATFLYFPKTNVLYRTRVTDILNKVLDLQLPRV